MDLLTLAKTIADRVETAASRAACRLPCASSTRMATSSSSTA